MRLVQAKTRIGPGSRSIRWSGVALGCLSLTLLTAGCHIPGTSAGQVPGGQQLTVAVVPGFDNAPLRVAIRDKLFSQHGVHVTVQSYPTLQKAYEAVTSGHANIISGDYASVFYEQARPRHTQLRLIADGYDAAPGVMEVLTLPGSGITTPQQLVGKAVATPQSQLAPSSPMVPYNIETLTTDSVLETDGVSPSSISWQPMAPANMINALRAHMVSAIVATEPYILKAETQLGAVELLDSCSGVTASLPLSGYFSTVSYTRTHAAALRGFQAALNQAKADAAEPGTVQPVLTSLPGMNAQQAALVTLGQYPTFLSVGQIQRVADLMYANGMIQTTISVKNLVFR